MPWRCRGDPGKGVGAADGAYMVQEGWLGGGANRQRQRTALFRSSGKRNGDDGLAWLK
jgi:hypothetical protein